MPWLTELAERFHLLAPGQAKQHRTALLVAPLVALLFLFGGVSAAYADGVVTDCTNFDGGPGTLESVIQDGGLITFACSGTILVTQQMGITKNTIIDGAGQRVVLQSDGDNRFFDVAGLNNESIAFEIHHLTLVGGNALDDITNTGGGAISSRENVTITNSTLISNTAEYGGAIDQRKGTLVIINSVLAQNIATGGGTTGGGGAINQFTEITFPKVRIYNSTIVDNNAPNVAGRDGLWVENGVLHLANTILANNGSTNCTIETYSEPSSNPVYEVSGANFSTDETCPGTQTGDPRLAPFGDFGGLTSTYALLPDSPAIDAVPAGYCSAGVDQRGAVRPRDGDLDGVALCDAGAYEYGTRFLVNQSNTEGLVGYWRLDESSGVSTFDGAGNGHTGAVVGAATFSTDHPAYLYFSDPGSLAINGAGGYVEVADAAALNPADGITVAAWVRVDDGSTDQAFVGKATAADGEGYYLGMAQGNVMAVIGDSAGGIRQVSGGPMPVRPWVHVAMTWAKNGLLTVYVNGRPTGTIAAANQPMASTSGPLRIGATPWDPAGLSLRGAIDDVRLYSRVLAAGQIQALASGRACGRAGTTWGDAVPDLQCALAETMEGNEVWVAQGKYTPTTGADRTATFAIDDGVAVYGGFAGIEEARTDRDPATNRTVLSGDIDLNDITDETGVVQQLANVAGANAYNVVMIGGSSISPVLDGFTVTAGHADGAAGTTCGPACGGGIYIANGSPMLSDLRLIANQAAKNGGGIFSASENTEAVDIIFAGNQAENGGALYAQDGNSVLVNVAALGNRATVDGGALYFRYGAPKLTNISIGGNRADGNGGGLAFQGGTPLVDNSIVAKNSAGGASQVYTTDGAVASFRFSLVEGGCPANASCTQFMTGDPLFEEVPNSAGAPTTGGSLQLAPPSPAIDTGDNTAGTSARIPIAAMASINTDLAGNPRIRAARIPGPIIDLGAYEAANTPPNFTSVPKTSVTATYPYSYQVSVVDPNNPTGSIPTVVTVAVPGWLQLTGGGSGYQLAGTPAQSDAGSHGITLRAADNLGAEAEQTYTLQVQYRTYYVWLPVVQK